MAETEREKEREKVPVPMRKREQRIEKDGPRETPELQEQWEMPRRWHVYRRR